MHSLYIPHLQSKLELVEDWSPEIFDEYRNQTLIQKLTKLNINSLGPYIKGSLGKQTIPKGTVLKVDRIYIRNGQKDYDSVTFRIIDSPVKELVKARFWVKLKDANLIKFEPWTDFSEL